MEYVNHHSAEWQEEYESYHSRAKCNDRYNSCAECNDKCYLGTIEVESMKNPDNWIIPTEEADKHRIKFDKNTCPECGVELANEGGCVTCKNCGYSKCD